MAINPSSRVATKLRGSKIFHFVSNQRRLSAMPRSGSHKVDSQRYKMIATQTNSVKADIVAIESERLLGFSHDPLQEATDRNDSDKNRLPKFRQQARLRRD